MNNVESATLRVVVFQDGEQYIAQCLEYDICAQAPDLNKLELRFKALMALEREYSIANNKKPFEGIGPAPQHFQMMWEKRTDFVSRTASTGKEQPLELALCAA